MATKTSTGNYQKDRLSFFFFIGFGKKFMKDLPELGLAGSNPQSAEKTKCLLHLKREKNARSSHPQIVLYMCALSSHNL